MPINLMQKTSMCDFAYTVDGGPLGELQYEPSLLECQNFTSKDMCPPRNSKGQMVNALQLAIDFK